MIDSGAQFRQSLKNDFDAFVKQQAMRFPEKETLRIDLHCHDHNSDVPDELLGRILRWPETWIKSETLCAALNRHGTDVITITNHNNARSCFDLLDRGMDVLVGAEFTCFIPAFDVSVHVLTYGFDTKQEEHLNKQRGDLERFLDYTLDQDLVTILAHPLFVHGEGKHDPVALMEYLTLLFDRFEVINGQRDTWQNMLIIAWLRGLTAERIEAIGRRFGIRPDRFCHDGWRKWMTGGSDDHMAMFVGHTGTIVHVPNLAMRLRGQSRSSLVLNSLREGLTAPYGSYTVENRLSAALLDYFCQIAMHAEDPGLVRMILHQGSAKQKLWAFVMANGAFELKRHRFTSNFIKAAHDALHGIKPGFFQRHMVTRQFRPLVTELDKIAQIRTEHPALLDLQLHSAIPKIFHTLNTVLAERVSEKISRYQRNCPESSTISLAELISRFELPVDIRTIMGESSEIPATKRISNINLKTWSDGLPFPALAAVLIGGSAYAGAKVLFANRPSLEAVSENLGQYQHPRRALWLSDTFFDKNGVATSLQLIHHEVKKRNLPIDFVICHESAQSEPHLHVLRPITSFDLPFYQHQAIRIFDLMELQKLFVEGGYDRIICSTELLMGMAAMYLSNAFSIPSYFYVHTDWLDFVRGRLSFDLQNIDRVRRMLRTFYRTFDGLFVLNTEQMAWFASDAMNIPKQNLHLTSHWITPCFYPHVVDRSLVFPGIRDDCSVMLYVGRISEEKGVMELPRILADVRQLKPNVELVVVGSGPAEDALKHAMPHALYIPWMPKVELARVYSAADVFVFPSRFDTFGNVIVESLACGLPVVAYAVKGPRDIIRNGECGFSVDSECDMVKAIASILNNPVLSAQLKTGSVRRAGDFSVEDVLTQFMRALDLPNPTLADSYETESVESGSKINADTNIENACLMTDYDAYIRSNLVEKLAQL